MFPINEVLCGEVMAFTVHLRFLNREMSSEINVPPMRELPPPLPRARNNEGGQARARVSAAPFFVLVVRLSETRG